MRTACKLVPALAAICALFVTPSRAQDAYPSRVVKIVNPYIAGSTTDVLARALAVGLSNKLGREFIIENKPGAGGSIGALSVVRADPDGYTLLFAPALVLSVYPQARTDAGYKPDALVPVCQTFTNAMALAVLPGSPIKNVADLVAMAKARPGALNYGHQGVLTIPHLAMEEFLQAAQIDIKDIPFRGEPLVLTDLLGGRLDVASLVLGSAHGQNIRVIGIFGEARHPAFPDVPTMKEQGYDVSPASFGGLFAATATPTPILSTLTAACEFSAKSETYAGVAKRAAQPMDYYANAAAFRARLARDIEAKARVLPRLKTQ